MNAAKKDAEEQIIFAMVKIIADIKAQAKNTDLGWAC